MLSGIPPLFVGCRENFGCSTAENDAPHGHPRATMNIYVDVVTDELSTASLKLAELAFRPNGA
jgi:hypothetical protein